MKSQNIDRVEGKCYRMIIISTDNTYQRTVVSKRYDDEEEHDDDDDDMFTVYQKTLLPQPLLPSATVQPAKRPNLEKTLGPRWQHRWPEDWP